MSNYDFSKVNFADPEIQRRLSQAFAIILDNAGLPSLEANAVFSLSSKQTVAEDDEHHEPPIQELMSTVPCTKKRRPSSRRQEKQFIQLELGI